MVLPEGFALPPLPHTAALFTGAVLIAWSLVRARPPVSSRLILETVPWIIVGSALHTLYQLTAVPASMLPFLGTPAVYVTTFILAGGTLVVAHTTNRVPGRVFGGTGVVAFLLTVGGLFVAAPGIHPQWLIVGLVASTAITAAAWVAFRWFKPAVPIDAPLVSQLVILAHALDGVSTAIGVDLLGFGERTPASQAILDFAAALPTAPTLGTGWLFVLVKVGIATAVVWVFAGYVREDPVTGNLLLTGIIAVGLGPGAHNLLLYTVAV